MCLWAQNSSPLNCVCVCTCVFLSQCAVVSLESVCAGLLLCCIAVESVSLSKRFIPELVNYLLGLLHLAVPTHTCTGNTQICRNSTHIYANNTHTCTYETVHTNEVETAFIFSRRFFIFSLFVCVSLDYQVVPPFRQQGKSSELLHVCDPQSAHSWTKKSISLSSAHRITATTEGERDHYK